MSLIPVTTPPLAAKTALVTGAATGIGHAIALALAEAGAAVVVNHTGQFTRILAKEFGSRGITINAISPGATETETYRTGKSAEFLASLEAMSAFGRLGRPAEIADVVAFVASDAARWITAQIIRVNSGTV